MRTSGEQLQSLATEGRFDEASQKDVLELAARLQRMHLETMSADEIEQAAVEGGMNAEFVREAIRRVSSGSEQQAVQDEQEPASNGKEWPVIFVPVIVFGLLGLRYLSRHGELTGTTVGLGIIGAGVLAALGALAAVGIRSLLVPGSQPKALDVTGAVLRREMPRMNAFSLLFQGLIAFALFTVPFTWPRDVLDASVFILIVLPFVGGWEPRVSRAFWKGFGYYGVMGFLAAMGDLVGSNRGELAILPIYTAGFGALGGIAALIGHGVRRLVYRPAPAQPTLSGRAQMLEQLFELQAALERHQETRAFLSVDVVGSSAMKDSANPLEAEHSFRQYQEWVAERVRLFGGEIQVTAGDGAMAMFRESHSAIAAAKRIQLDVAEFNATKNRLGTPFRLRCGIADGKIGIDSRTPLGQIQSPVLDRAAFLQKYAEPGSVVVSRELLETAMPILGSLHQRELIDGKPVFAWP